MVQGGNEAFSRVVIDALLADVGWNLTDGRTVRYEYVLPDGIFAVWNCALVIGRPSAISFGSHSKRELAIRRSIDNMLKF